MRNASPVIILAAGLSTRMGFPKLLLARNDKPVLVEMVERLRESSWGSVAVVISNEQHLFFLEECSERLGEILHCVQNDRPEEGMISSIRLGLDWVHADGDGVLVWQADHPLVGVGALRRLCNAASQDTVVIPTYEGYRGHPTWWGRGAFPALRSPIADHGARSLLKSKNINVVELQVEDEAVLHNIDTPEDAKRFGLTRFEFGQ